MKICAISDIHGYLPNDIKECDVVCICGDIIPGTIQYDYAKSKKWFCTLFFNWVTSLQCKKVIFIAGNHDFFIQDAGYSEILRLIIENGLSEKLVYLEDNDISYEGLTFYGCPWVIGPTGWAFYSVNAGDKYNLITDCDILLTHQPPRIDKLGCSYPNTIDEIDYGSDSLRTAISQKKIRYCFSGHIHSGDHNEVLYPTSNVDTKFYNVSMKDEDYRVSYQPLYINIERKNNETD